MKLRYVGPFDGIEIDALGVEVARGGTFEAPPKVAALLLEQADNYARVAARPPRKKKAPRSAAAVADPTKVEE